MKSKKDFDHSDVLIESNTLQVQTGQSIFEVLLELHTCYAVVLSYTKLRTFGKLSPMTGREYAIIALEKDIKVLYCVKKLNSEGKLMDEPVFDLDFKKSLYFGLVERDLTDFEIEQFKSIRDAEFVESFVSSDGITYDLKEMNFLKHFNLNRPPESASTRKRFLKSIKNSIGNKPEKKKAPLIKSEVEPPTPKPVIEKVYTKQMLNNHLPKRGNQQWNSTDKL